MPKLDKVAVELTLPFLGKIGGSWAPDDAERQAAWEMYVELVTRVAVEPLAPEEGLLREALTSYHSLFGTTRTILRQHGPRIAQPHRGGDLSFGYLALAVLNGALRPVLTRWHPELLAHETRRPASESPVAWERSWPHATELRQQLDATHRALLDYADLLADVADIPSLHTHSHPAANKPS